MQSGLGSDTTLLDTISFDESNNPSPDTDPLEDNCAMDSHGTHVAGIVATDASNISSGAYATLFPFTGVAPGVTIGA